MKSIFNTCGEPVSWMEEGIVFNNEGFPIAFLDDGGVLAAESGDYLGQFEEGVFHDRLGCVVAFIQGVSPFDLLPEPHEDRVPPVVQSTTVPGRACLPATPPPLVKSLQIQSSLGWDQFLQGSKAEWKTRR